ncbi:MAG: S49 family peptidase [Gammaproteobacteria bacterium]|nr:S49 family peptidase [Gammaproteobacteria bacterium]MDH5694134.1 S49 family peptidase [Gammaproteobacteria bacterium]
MSDENQDDKAKENLEKAGDPWTENPVSQDDNQSMDSSAASSEDAARKSVADKKKSLRKKLKEKEDWQSDLLNRLAFASVNEQRRTRRWNIFFKSLVFVYLFTILFLLYPEEGSELAIGPHTGIIEISGVISDSSAASADTIISGLRSAFQDSKSKGVILRINSPGGSPVQAGYVYDEIIRLREKYPNKPVYSVVTDMCASAAYYIAASSDAIYADKASIVGSIGVLMDGYGFTELMKKAGVERRLMTAGENKAMMDPFSPLKKEHKQHMQNLLNDVHKQFIDSVKEGRGERLARNSQIFSGLFWTGEKSVELGLVDGLGSSSYVARELIGEEKIVDYTPRPNYLDRFADRIGVAMANAIESFVSRPGMR